MKNTRPRKLRVKNLGFSGEKKPRWAHELWRKEVLDMVGRQDIPAFREFLKQKDLSQYNYFYNFMLPHLGRMPVDWSDPAT